MQIEEIRKLLPKVDERINTAREYVQARKKAAEAKFDVEVMLAANLHRIRAQKSNVGYEMAILMLMEPGFLDKDSHHVVKKCYEEWKRNEGIYKGLERLMDALETRVSFVQSIMRYERENT